MKHRNTNLAKTVISSLRSRNDRPALPPEIRRGDDCLVLASYNVHKAVGTDGKRDPHRIIDVIREIGPDVMALQEADMRFGDKEGILDLQRLKIETGLQPVPVNSLAKSHGWCGNVLLFRKAAVRDLHQISLPGLEPRGALITEIELQNGQIIRIVAVHLGLLRRHRHKQIKTLLGFMADREEFPTILMGDLNEWRLGRGSALKLFENTVGELPPALPSFPAKLPMLSLDRIIPSRPGIIDKIAVHDTPLARLASDHLPIAARIEL